MAQDDYLSRISTAPGGVGSLQLGPQAYIDPRDQRYVVMLINTTCKVWIEQMQEYLRLQ